VKENEKFKVAKEIIEKYGVKEELDVKKSGEEGKSASDNEGKSKAPPTRKERAASATDKPAPLQQPKVNPNVTPPRVPRLNEIADTKFHRTPVRPFIVQGTSPIDRVLDYVMGESMTNRYALICSNCRSHNGMALREEFEQIAYFCFKCSAYNPSVNEKKATQQKRPPPNIVQPVFESRPESVASQLSIPAASATKEEGVEASSESGSSSQEETNNN